MKTETNGHLDAPTSKEKEEEEVSIEELHNQIQKQQKTIEFLKTALFDLEEIMIGDSGIAYAGKQTDENGSLLDRIQNLERDELDLDQLLEAQSDAALPIQQLTAGRKAGHVTDDEYKNKYRATVVWSAFTTDAIKEYGKYKLSAKRVKQILDDEELPNDRKTVNRVMKFVASLSNPDPENKDPEAPGNVVTLQKGSMNMLVADQDDLHALVGENTEDVTREADTVFEQLDYAEVETDD